MEGHALQACLDRHIAQLPDGQRDVLVQHTLLDLPMSMICESLSLTASNSRILLHRARLRLHAMITQYKETGNC